MIVSNDYLTQHDPPSGDTARPKAQRAGELAEEAKAERDYKGRALISFLSEDFHFTSKITREVIQDISHAACSEYSQMCDTHLYLVDARTFLDAYENGKIDLDVVRSRMKTIRKKGKRLRQPKFFQFLNPMITVSSKSLINNC